MHSCAKSFQGFIISGMSLVELESLYNLRALQLLDRKGRLEVPAIIIVRPDSAACMFARFGQRMRSGWPFRSALFIAEGATVELLRREGLFAMEFSEARQSSLNELFGRNEGVLPVIRKDQPVAIQIQPSWYHSGSHTVFSNQIDALLDQNWFILRIFVDTEHGSGPTMQRRMKTIVREANVDATPHLETIACAAGVPELITEATTDNFYHRLASNRMQAVIADDVMTRLAARADVAVVNYALHVPFALKACPAAFLVLETHDDMTRNNVMRSRATAGSSFPTIGAIKRHMQLERLIWRAADVCIALSLLEFTKIRRHASRCVYVLPRPYVRRAREAGADAQWDILIVMNPHHFNVPALDWFLEDVIFSDPRLALLNIAIAGRINECLETAWKDRLPNTRWLGYVKDIDELRDRARLSVCPDQSGTGVAIKTLTAIAAVHPLVGTLSALRGLGDEILELIPPADNAGEMQRQIIDLLDNEDLLRERRSAVFRAGGLLWPAATHEKALAPTRTDVEEKSNLRARLLDALEAKPAPEDAVNPDDDSILIRFGKGCNDRPYLGRGWLHDEPGGRWSDGASATIRIPATWLSSPRWLVICFMPDFLEPDFALKHEAKPLSVVSRTTETVCFELDGSCHATDGFVEFEIVRSNAFCPRDVGISDDERVLGLHVRSIEIVRRS